MIPLHITVTVLETGQVLSETDDKILPEMIYTGQFSYSLKFTAETKASDGGDSGGTGGSGGTLPAATLINAISVAATSPGSGIVCESTAPDTLKISGSYFTAFDDYYLFVRKTGEQIKLLPDTKETDIALIQYKMPSQPVREFIYTVSVEWPAGSSYEGVPISNTVNIKHTAYWDSSAAALNISLLKDKSI